MKDEVEETAKLIFQAFNVPPAARWENGRYVIPNEKKEDMDKKKREKFYDIAESFGVYRSYGEKIGVIRELKSLYGQHTTLAELEECLWNERQRVEEKIKNQL